MIGKKNQTVLVTGASGFVGQHVCAALEGQGHEVRRIVRETSNAQDWEVPDLSENNIPDIAFVGVDIIIHLAASIPGQQDDPYGTKTADMAARIAKQARRNAIPRFVHISSVAARLAEEDDPSKRAYGVQKLEAEMILADHLGSGCRLVTLRPPAIYGQGAKGNFAVLLDLIERRIPLPLSGASEGRCYFSVRNLCALILTLVQAKEEQWASADRQVFEPHDGPVTTTNDLALMLANGIGTTPLLFWAPEFTLRIFGRFAKKLDQIDALFTPLICRDTPSLAEAFDWHSDEVMPESLSYLDDKMPPSPQ